MDSSTILYNRAADNEWRIFLCKKCFLVTTRKREDLIDITSQVKNIVSEAKQNRPRKYL